MSTWHGPALVDVVKSLQVPGTYGGSEHSAPRLAAYIKAHLASILRRRCDLRGARWALIGDPADRGVSGWCPMATAQWLLGLLVQSAGKEERGECEPDVCGDQKDVFE